MLTRWDRGESQPLFWTRVIETLTELGIESEVIQAEVRPLVTQDQPPAERRAYLPPTSFLHELVASPASVFVCVEYGVATAMCIALARMRGRRAIIFQEHRGREGLSLRAGERAYRRALLRLASAVIANTDAAYAELVGLLRIDRQKVYRATLLVPPERSALTAETIAVFPCPRHRPLFLYVGQLVRRKNVEGLLEAAATLRSAGSEFEVWIVGDGPERAHLETRASNLMHDGFVRFLGSWPSSEVGHAYQAADLFVMPSVRDYRSVAVLEAMRFGKPVIDSTQDGNAGDLVRHDVTGLLFDPNQPNALSAAMQRTISDPALVRRLGQNTVALMKDVTPYSAGVALRNIIHTVSTRQYRN